MQNSVNHRILERKLRFWAILKPCLVEYHKEKSIHLFFFKDGLEMRFVLSVLLLARPFKSIQMHDLPKFIAATSVAICSLWTIFHLALFSSWTIQIWLTAHLKNLQHVLLLNEILISAQARLPAEFKHINKRRKRN